MSSGRLLRLLALWTSLAVGVVRCCPSPCLCTDKYSHQFADCAYKDLLEVPTQGLPSNVTTFSLSANKITYLKAGTFVTVTQTTSLWLSHNQIVTVERDTLAPLVQLRNLDLSHNNIVNFPWEDLRNLTALQLLKMNNNEMTALPADAFSTLKELRSLRINNNRFAVIARGTFDALTSMSHLQIFNNPFACSCGLQWLRDWITTTKISVPEQESILCDAPEQLKGAMLTKTRLECKAPTVTLTYQPNLQNTEIYQGFTVVLNCETGGAPRPQVAWEVKTTAGGEELKFALPWVVERSDVPVNVNDKTTSGRFLVFQNGTLVIPRVSKKEEGNYSCSAVNEVGAANRSVRVALSGSPGTTKHAGAIDVNPSVHKSDITPEVNNNKPVGGSKTASKNNVINWPKSEDRLKVGGGPSDPLGGKHNASGATGDGGVASAGAASADHLPSSCGVNDGNEYISNHAFNLSAGNLKQYTFDFGVIALEVSETEAKVQLNPLKLPNTQNNLHINQQQGQQQEVDTVYKELFKMIQTTPKKNAPIDMLYLCVDTGNGHSRVQWSKIEEGVNSYRFHGLQPGTNYTLCFTYGGLDCQVQVVFTTRKRIPSLLIIVVVSTFLLALATVPLLGATCCHLLYKYQGKTYKLFMKAQNPDDQLEKQMAAANNTQQRASFVESEKTFDDPSELGDDGEGVGRRGLPGRLAEGEEDEDDEEGEEGEMEGSVETEEALASSSSKTNHEEFEMGSEYSDRLPLGAEAVNISQEINGNYKDPSR